MDKQNAAQTLAVELTDLARAAGSVGWKWWDSNSTLRLTTKVKGRHGADGDAISAYRDSVQCPEPFRAFIEAASPAAVLALVTENEFLTESRNEAREDRNKIGDRYDQIKIENNELRKTAERAEYWKQRAKSAEGHLFSSDWRDAALELHRHSAHEATPWNELTGSQQAALYSAAGAVIAVVNNRRETRQPLDTKTTKDAEQLRAFANDMIGACFEGGSFDGSDIQDAAVKHGLLRIEPRSEECGELCACREYGFPAECYRKTPILNAETSKESSNANEA